MSQNRKKGIETNCRDDELIALGLRLAGGIFVLKLKTLIDICHK